MVSQQARQEMEEALGQVPEWADHVAESAGDHTWGIFRDLILGSDTDLTPREKALIGVGVAAAISCPYCTYFHKEEARLSEVTDEELEEAVNVASTTKYISTVLHGNEIVLEDFETETDEIVAHVRKQQMAAADD